MSKIDDLANLPGQPAPDNSPRAARGPALPPLRSGVEPPVLTDTVGARGTAYVDPQPGLPRAATAVGRGSPALPPLGGGVEPPVLTDPLQPGGTQFVEPPTGGAIASGARTSTGAPARSGFPLPATPPDRGAALGEAVAARGGNLPPVPEGGALRAQMGVLTPNNTAPVADTVRAGAPSPIAQAALGELPAAPSTPNMNVKSVGSPPVPPAAPNAQPNPNVASGRTGGAQRTGVLSTQAEEFLNSGAASKIPDQVGNPKLNPVPPQGVAGADAGARQAGRGAPVPNMPKAVEPVASPTTGTPAAGTGANATSAGASAASSGGRYGRIAEAASKSVRAALPETLGGTPLASGSKLLNGVGSAARWVGPALEAGQVAGVALDKKSSKADVAEQVAVGTGRGASALAGAGLGGAAGAALGPVGGVLGAVAGGAAGYWGGDEAIRKIRSVFGLDERTPYERMQERQAAPQKPGKPAAGIAQAAGAAASAPPGASVPTVPTSAAGATPAGATNYDALAARYASLEQEQRASPIAFTAMGGVGGHEIHYKNGDVVRLANGAPLPDDAARFYAVSDEMNVLRSGRMPGQAAAPQQAPQMQPTHSAQAAPATAQPGDFVRAYGGAAQRVGQALGVDPNVVLGQWGLETGWGKSIIPGTNNLGNIKDFSGAGVAATDNQTGSVDKYMQFASPDAFADHYADLIRRKFPGAVGAGADAAKFGAGLKAGGYAQDPQYAAKIQAAFKLAAGQAGGQQQGGAAPAASAGTAPDFMRAKPVHVIEGVNDFMEMPAAGGGFAKVPMSIYQAGAAQGNAAGALQDYLSNQNAGIANRQNPAKAELDKTIANAAIAAQSHVQAAQVGKSRYLVAGGGTDPATGLSMPQAVFDTVQGRPADMAPKTWPMPPDTAIEELRKAPQTAPAFDATFGPGAAQKAMGR
jgi:flagellum-specific peptidoglycan hydrolase FlgJ